MSKFCPNCGNELADDVRFCNRCGYKIADNSNIVVQQNTSSEITSNLSTSNNNGYKPKSINFLQDQAAKIDEEKKKSDSKTTIIVVIITTILIIAAIILSVYVLFFTGSKDNNSNSSASNSSIKNSSSQTDSSKNDSSLSDSSSTTSSSFSEPDSSSSEPEIEIVPIQKRDIESIVVKKNASGDEKLDSKQYTTLIKADDKSIKECLSKLKADKQAVVYNKGESGVYPILSSNFILEETEKHTPLITIKTTQKEEFFKNANELSIIFNENKLVDKKDEILRDLLDSELAEYIINGEVDKSLDFNMSYYLNDKAIKVNYERAKKEKDYVVNISYTVMSNTNEEKEALDGQNNIDIDFSLLNDFKTPLSSYFTTKSKAATDFDSIKKQKSLFDSALKTLVADNPIVVSNTNILSVQASNNGTQKLIFELCGYYKESRPADQCNTLKCEFWTDSKNTPTHCEITMSISASKNEDALKKAFESTTKLLYPDLKVNNEGIGEITINNQKYKVEVRSSSPLDRKITINRITK